MTNTNTQIESIISKTMGRVGDLTPYFEKNHHPKEALSWARNIASIETTNIIVELLVEAGLTKQNEANELMLNLLGNAQENSPKEDFSGVREIIPSINYAIQMIGPNFPDMVEERLQVLYDRENAELGITS